jgi:predicted PurR-regulated permease PerM
MKSKLNFPFYAQASLIIIGLFVLFYILFIGQGIIIPLIYSIIIAVTMSPMVDFLVRKKMNRVLAITISLILVSSVVVAITVLLASQFNEFTNALPNLIDKFYEALQECTSWISQYFNIGAKEINAYLEDTETEILKNSSTTIGVTLNSILELLVILVLIPVYVFMILYYKPLLLDFIRKLFGPQNRTEVDEILRLTKNIIQRYLLALLLEAAIITVLNSIGLLAIGLNYAIVLGLIGALLNIIPYVGGLIAIVLYIMIALVTKDSFYYVFYILVLYTIIQLIDNNLIVPKLVGSKVKINALVAIVSVIVGGAMWGISGMFLSIPIIAILKVIFDHISQLKPWGFLLGDTMPEISILKLNLKKVKLKIGKV